MEDGWTCTLGDLSSASMWIVICGDGKVIHPTTGYCDDGNTTPGDGWDATWAVESRYHWTLGDSTTASVCTDLWGDGVVVAPTAGYCDDGNIVPGDGCDASCAVETNWDWTLGDLSTKSVWSDLCGDGKVITPLRWILRWRKYWFRWWLK